MYPYRTAWVAPLDAAVMIGEGVEGDLQMLIGNEEGPTDVVISINIFRLEDLALTEPIPVAEVFCRDGELGVHLLDDEGDIASSYSFAELSMARVDDSPIFTIVRMFYRGELRFYQIEVREDLRLSRIDPAIFIHLRCPQCETFAVSLTEVPKHNALCPRRGQPIPTRWEDHFPPPGWQNVVSKDQIPLPFAVGENYDPVLVHGISNPEEN